MLSKEVDRSMVSNPAPFKWSKLLQIKWLGQTVASLCWIASVFVYGLTEAGDYLQLCAASAWLLANIAFALSDEDEPEKQYGSDVDARG